MKFNFNKGLGVLLFMTSVFIVSGLIFLVLLCFGMYGLSRLLIYFRLAEFTYNQSFMDNLFYYGSYIGTGYFLLIAIEYMFDELKMRFADNKYFQGWYFHILTVTVSTIIFYLCVHINYQYIHINFFVIYFIIAFLYLLTELFYPESEDLNRKD